MKLHAASLVLALLCGKIALAYPEDYCPFEPGNEPSTFSIDPCETAERTPAIAVSTDFSFSCPDASEQISVSWNPIAEGFG